MFKTINLPSVSFALLSYVIRTQISYLISACAISFAINLFLKCQISDKNYGLFFYSLVWDSSVIITELMISKWKSKGTIEYCIKAHVLTNKCLLLFYINCLHYFYEILFYIFMQLYFWFSLLFFLFDSMTNLVFQFASLLILISRLLSNQFL